MLRSFARILLPCLALAACSSPSGQRGAGPASSSEVAAGGDTAAPPADVDTELARCEARWDALSKAPGRAYGEGPLEVHRERMLGRAKGAVTLFVRPPAATALPTADTPKARELAASKAKLERGQRTVRIAALLGRHKQDKAGLRAILLREGYLYADDPDDAYELEARVKLADLFDDEELVLERGEETFELRKAKKNRETVYEYASGPREGRNAQVLFGDRVRPKSEAFPGPALSRDILALSRREHFDRMDIAHVADDAILSKVRIEGQWVRAVIEAKGAALSLGCLVEPKATRDAVAAKVASAAWRYRAEKNLRDVVSEFADEALPFDRPRDEKGPDKDGTLRPYWYSAYKRGSTSFDVDGQTYPVFFADGRPATPIVCADFVMDSYERAAGSWYTPRGDVREKTRGRLDWNDFGSDNRRGVIGLGKFAEDRPELFSVRRFEGKERIPFAQREAYFDQLLALADTLHAGDVLAIQGLKRDDRVHQHAIFLEFTDPITGFPAGLADQMKNPRRRSWEGIMAEAPKRSLLFHAQPTEKVLRLLDGEPALRPKSGAGDKTVATQ